MIVQNNTSPAYSGKEYPSDNTAVDIPNEKQENKCCENCKWWVFWVEDIIGKLGICKADKSERCLLSRSSPPDYVCKLWQSKEAK